MNPSKRHSQVGDAARLSSLGFENGHTHRGTHIIDSHIGPVIDDVWRLLADAHARAGAASILLEWDAEIPGFEATHAEALRAKQYLERTAA